MLQSMVKIALAAALCGLLLAPSVSWGQATRARKVDDDLDLFSKNAVASANATIAEIKQKFKKDLVIETREKGPDKDKAAKWVEDRADTLGVDGVFIFISKKPRHFEVYVGNKTMQAGYFTRSDRDHLKSILQAKLGKKSDQALTEIANYTLDTMNRHAPTTTSPRKKAQAPAPAPHVGERPPGDEMQHQVVGTVSPWLGTIGGLICFGLVVLVVIWVIFGLIRAMTGFGGGGGGYGGGPGYGYGGGGGGFLTGMLGGMFGSMAGMWMYNNFFGGHASYGPNGYVNWGGGSQGGSGAAIGESGKPYEADTSGTSEGGDWGDDDQGAAGGKGGGEDAGGDWGGNDKDAGGDAGGDWGGNDKDAGGADDWGGGGDAGGGDWGAGGDAGGGDWGGGGGDFGGGGGGDW